MNNAEKIKTFLIERFLATGENCAVQEIAAGTGLSESTIRTALRKSRGEDAGALADVLCQGKWRQGSTRPGTNRRSEYRVMAWGPSRQWLREIINNSKAGT